MVKQKVLPLFILLAALVLASCGMVGNNEDDLGEKHNTGFQINGPLEPDDPFPYFKITEIFDGRGSLEDAWDSVDGPTFNSHLSKTVDENMDPFITFSKANSGILGETSGLMTLIFGEELANIIDYLTNSADNTEPHAEAIGRFYTKSGSTYQQGFYALLDELYKDGEDSGKMEFPVIGRKIVQRLLDRKNPQTLHNDMEDLVEDITDEDFIDDFNDLHEALGKLVVRADYPIWTNASGTPLDKSEIDPNNPEHTNTGIGNAVAGLFSQAKWANRMLRSTEERGFFHDLVNEAASLFDPSPSSLNSDNIRKLLENIDRNFTAEGDEYAADDRYSTNNEFIYSDTELGNTIRELLPGSLQLLFRSDRPASLTGDVPGSEKKYVLREMAENLKALQFNPDNHNIEQSLINMMQHDVWGRDRTNPESGAWPASFLESLLFITHVSSNLGWKDRRETENGTTSDEITETEDSRYEHGHGDHTGSLTLNDSLFSLKTHLIQGALGLYDLALKEQETVEHPKSDGRFRFRSRTPFTLSTSDNYQFHFDQDYEVLNFLAGPCVGDFGVSEGGNPAGTATTYDGEGYPSTLNKYKTFSPDGRNESVMSAWTLGWIVRACFNGEGPYYYADPNAETVTVNEKQWKRYLRPNGKTYALVSETNEYLYPSEGDDPEDDETGVIHYNDKRQRYNRFKSEWKTDYYMSTYIHSTYPVETVYHATLTQNSSNNIELVTATGGNPTATRLTYNELVAETESTRACSSPEEALFRNYQWLMTEKKMVLIIPLVLSTNFPGQTVVYQILEANGWSGLTNLRKHGTNHTWAKSQTTGESGIPGDYRIEIVSSDSGGGTSAENIYLFTLDCGHATPAIVGHNIPALYRLGFPVDRTERIRGDASNGVTDFEIGSREFSLDDTVWKNRNAILPPFISLVAAIYNNTPAETTSVKAGLKSFVEGTSPLIKPLVYYQKNNGNSEYSHPYKTWKVRVHGNDSPGLSPEWNHFSGDDYLRSSADFNNHVVRFALSWDGTPEEKRYYQPAVMKTLLNILIDSDITAEPDEATGYTFTRMDGLLPMLAKTKTATAVLNALMSNANDSDLLYEGLEQVNGALKFTKGEMTKINHGTTGAYGEDGSYKAIQYPAWMFATGTETGTYGEFTAFTGVRKDDVVLDRGIDRLLGHRAIDSVNDGYGISAYVEEQRAENWNDFYKTADTIEDFVHPDSPYSLVQSFLNINDALFARDRLYEDIEIAGLLYASGKLLTVKNGKNWISQGTTGFDDLFKLLTIRLPQIHTLMKDENGFSGDNYHASLVINRDILKEDGLGEYIVGALSTEEDFETIFSDVKAFLADPLVTENAPLWTTLADLLSDMAEVLDVTKDGDELEDIYQDFGIQQN